MLSDAMSIKKLGLKISRKATFFVILHAVMTNETPYIYSQSVLDFVRVSTEYCKYIEQCQGSSLADFTRMMRGLLPMV